MVLKGCATMGKSIPIITFFVCTAAGLSAEAQDFLVNSSFEAPAISANGRLTGGTPTSWSSTGTPILLNGTYGKPGLPGPKAGQQYVALGGGASLSQGFVVSVPDRYSLTWFDRAGVADGTTPAPHPMTPPGPAGKIA